MKKCILLILIIGCLTGCIDKIDPTSVVVNSENGKPKNDMVFIPSGNFQMGNNKFTKVYVHTWVDKHRTQISELVRETVSEKWEEVYTDAYFIDRNEVSRGEYKMFCDATGAIFPNARKSEYSGNSYPITNISVEDAKAYAEWVGKRLPTSAEWEKAARGGLIKESYVQGQLPVISRNNWNALSNFHLLNQRASHILFSYVSSRDGRSLKPQPRRNLSVHTNIYRVNGYGIHDMGGNVSEYIQESLQPNLDGKYIVRGASYFSKYGYLSMLGRSEFIDAVRIGNADLVLNYKDFISSRYAIGFRCVRDLK